jgi:NUMOD3 motif
MFFTYAHYKPEGGLFYIGKGKRRRAYAMDSRNSHWQNIVNKYGKPRVELLAQWDTEKEAFEHEKVLIACFKDMGYVLANKTDGGEGSSGYKHTKEQKLKNSLAKMGNIPWNKGTKGIMVAWNKGVPMSEEQKIKCSLAKKGKPSPAKGRKHTPETIEKIRLAKLGTKHTAESIAKLKLANIGRTFEKIKCPHCNKIGGLTGMPRWHFDNCKFKEIN